MTRYLAAFIFLIFTNSVMAQTRAIDSLLHTIYRTDTKPARLNAILNLCEEYQSLNRDTLDYYSYKAREIAAEVKDKKAIMLAEIAVANDYFRWGWIDSAIAVIDPVVKAKNLKDTEERSIYFKAARLQALYYGSHSRYQEALSNLYTLVKEAETYKDTLVMAMNMNSIASIALAREEPHEAVRWLLRTMYILNNNPKFDIARASVYANMAQSQLLSSHLDSAIYYSEKGTLYFKKVQNLYSLAIALQRQSDIYLKANELAKAESSLQELIKLRSTMGDGTVWMEDNVSLINFYIKTNQVDKAINYCLERLERGDIHSATQGKSRTLSNNLNIRLGYYELLAKCYKLKGDTDKYGQILEQIVLAKDSLTNTQAEMAIAEMQTKYEVQKKENTIIQQELTIAQKNNTLLLAGSGVALLILISFFVFRDYRKKQKYKTEKLLENEKDIAVKAVADAEEKERKRIAADLHDNLGAYAAAIASNTDMIQSDGVSEESKSALGELKNSSQAIVSQLSDTIWALNKDALTLTAISDRIKVFLNRIHKTYYTIEMEVVEKIENDISLPPTQAFHLFQVMQEAITNAVKHSGCNHLVVELTGKETWSVSIIDNGQGMKNEKEKQSDGNGLKNMSNRATISGWYIKWERNMPSGTSVSIQPMNNKN